MMRTNIKRKKKYKRMYCKKKSKKYVAECLNDSKWISKKPDVHEKKKKKKKECKIVVNITNIIEANAATH